MLPNEARWLQHDPNRFWMGELKLKLMRKVFASKLSRELAGHSAFSYKIEEGA
jgi:hypothetical protein